MTEQAVDTVVAHVDESDAVAHLLDTLRALHGPSYDFAVGSWSDNASLHAPPGRVVHRFIIDTADARIALQSGQVVRGVPPTGPYQLRDKTTTTAPVAAEVTAPHQEALWPGDVICVAHGEVEARLCGSGTYFDVVTEATAYPLPRLVLLRHLPDKPGGCAAYTGAFRREALPPVRATGATVDRRGVNRVNEHTLDMRLDRDRQPTPHHHGPVSAGQNTVVNHSETAIVLPRASYDLPEPEEPDRGRIALYRRPEEDPTDCVMIPVRPGSIVVTPAANSRIMGHIFENAFAMLVAIPGFVAPHQPIPAR